MYNHDAKNFQEALGITAEEIADFHKRIVKTFHDSNCEYDSQMIEIIHKAAHDSTKDAIIVAYMANLQLLEVSKSIRTLIDGSSCEECEAKSHCKEAKHGGCH